MKVSVIVLIFLLSVSLASPHCPKFTCDNSTAREGEECANEDVEYLKVKKCAKHLVCEPTRFGLKSVCVKAEKNLKAVAKERCNVTEDCYSKQCGADKLCIGKGAGEECTLTEECDVESYCVEKKCTAANNSCDGQKGCATNAFCYIPTGKKNGACITYASVESGKEALAPAACKSYYMDKTGKCASPPKLKNTGDYTCPNDGQCTYTVNDTEYKTPCECSKSDNGEESCPPGIGDLDLDSVFIDNNCSFRNS